MKIIILFFFLISINLRAHIITIGDNGDYATLSEAAAVAVAGDTLFLFSQSHQTNQYIENLHGERNMPICILADTNRKAVFSGGNQAIHFVNVSWLYISGLVFEQQKINGVNIDDGGDYSTPSRHITIEHCLWRGMDAGGNNDELKMSGVDSFAVRFNLFTNGSAGGSLVDMVGCHWGTFSQNRFENAGSNCIQAKGGTRFIKIYRNYFKNGGRRSINCGGSTDLPYFRPADADYEGKNIDIFSNIFIGSTAAIAFVTATECRFVNNTIIYPGRWIARVLQETDDERFIKCGNNIFSNNICYFNNNANHEGGINLGANTQPETFQFFNNLWYNTDNPFWDGPNYNFCHRNSIVNRTPRFIDLENENFALDSLSPAISSGKFYEGVSIDFYGKNFKMPPVIGAIEYKPDETTNIREPVENKIRISPVPASNYIELSGVAGDVYIYDIRGLCVMSVPFHSYGGGSGGSNRLSSLPDLNSVLRLDLSELPSGIYFVRADKHVMKFIKL